MNKQDYTDNLETIAQFVYQVEFLHRQSIQMSQEERYIPDAIILDILSRIKNHINTDQISYKTNSFLLSATKEHLPSKTKVTQTSFAARLRLALAHSGMKQSDLAWGIGVSQSTISALATGRVKGVGIERGAALSEALGVNLRWLMRGEGEMQPAKFLTHNDEV